MALLTHDQLQRAVELLQNLVVISPATPPTATHIGKCHYCGEGVRNIHSGIIHHTETCPWWEASRFADKLPSEWDDDDEEER